MSNSRKLIARVLIVEDEPLIAMLLQDVVVKSGCECTGICTNAEAAIALIEKLKIDAALLNLVLNGKPAYELCAALAVRNIPFAFASGVMREAIDPLWRDRLYIAKPFSEAEVRDVLAKLLATPETAVAQIIDNMPPPEQRAKD